KEEDRRVVARGDGAAALDEGLAGLAAGGAAHDLVVDVPEHEAPVAAPGDAADRLGEQALLAGREIADAGDRMPLDAFHVRDAVAVRPDRAAEHAAPEPARDHGLGVAAVHSHAPERGRLVREEV